MNILILVVVFCFSISFIWAVPVAFPGAEGFGAYAEGGRGGDVYYVTNTNDSGPGSLREGINSASGPRTIVFAVSGLIQLQSRLTVNKDYITIAGQTAPGDGICLRDYQLGISADHVIVRYIRSRLGAAGGQESDAISITSGNNIIMDHCSASWSVDECFSCSTRTPTIDNVTVQWSIISEALGDSIHSKGYHSYGALIRGCYGARYSYHHNLFAHNNGRNPRPGNYDDNPYTSDPLGLQFDFRNNVMYNWGGSHPSYDADTVSVCRMNYVGNYCKAGPASSYGYLYDTGSPYFMGYYEGNYWNGSIPSDPYSVVDFGSMSSGQIASWKQSVPFSTGPIITQTAQDAYASVLADAGASLARDSIDARIVNEVATGTVTYYGSVSGKPGIIDDESDVGGWPAYNSTAAPTDTDLDGMPDAWETAHSLNPTIAADRNDYDLDANYTNLEVYLNSLAGGTGTGDTTPPAAPTGLAALAGDGTVDLDWDDNSEPDLAGYYVYRSTTPGSGYLLTSDLLGNSDYTDDTAENGITYFYVATAIDTSSNESDSSDEVFATPVDMEFYRDTDDNQIIDMTDLAGFLAVWLQSDCLVTTGWDINNDCQINLDEFSLFAASWLADQTPPPVSLQYADVSCRTSLNNGSVSQADDNNTESNKLSVRGDSKAAKSWIKFDISGIDVSSLTSAQLRITLYEAKTSTCLLSAVNDDCTDNIGWGETDLTWNNAPGNYTSSDGVNPDDPITIDELQESLDPTKTALLGTVDYSYGGVKGEQFFFDVLSVLQADTDGIVQFVLHDAGGASNFATHDSSEGADYWPVLVLTGSN